MEAKDLRIGNYIKVRNNFSQVTSIESHEGEYFIYFAGGDDNLTIQGLEPIPLTEQILLKCGFEKTMSNLHKIEISSKTTMYLSFPDIEKGVYIYLSNGLTEVSLPKQNPFLHSLQNLYFVLTNKELEINL